jgi:LDH2 family malate/lactate/ureidoglycolate dehydrogenase
MRRSTVAIDSDVTHVPLSSLYSFSCDVLMAAGLPRASAESVATALTEADARSLSSHGVVRLLPVYVRRLERGTTSPTPDIRVVHQRGSARVVDGDGGPGQVVGRLAMDMAIELAQAHGVGAVGARNSSHYGIGALYVEQATRHDMIGLALTNATPNMPPAGGRSRFFGTNPLTIGIPGNGDCPLVLDMSTSVVARGKIVMAEKEGRSIPPGWAIDDEGRPTEDPATALLGAVLPMAGYKGAGLALMIDVLCGVLTGASFGQHIVDLYDEGDQKQDVGHFFIALAVDAFMPLPIFKERVRRFSAEVRSQPRLPGVDRIYLPGELEFEAAVRAAQDGVAISEAGRSELRRLATRLKVPSLEDRAS